MLILCHICKLDCLMFLFDIYLISEYIKPRGYFVFVNAAKH